MDTDLGGKGLTALNGLSPVHRLTERIDELASSIATSIRRARVVDRPFYHLHFEQVFPEPVYRTMLATLPASGRYRPASGRAAHNDLADGTHTRVKLDLFPEYTNRLEPEARDVWSLIGRALRSDAVKRAMIEKLATPLRHRFGPRYAEVDLYPVPTLTRDVSGYHIHPHTDTHWKAITSQFYLPADERLSHLGTVLHEPDYRSGGRTRMAFLPNSGYAFVVGPETWHSVDTIGPGVTARDSILHNYFVSTLPVSFLINRTKRVANFLRELIRSRQSLK